MKLAKNFALPTMFGFPRHNPLVLQMLRFSFPLPTLSPFNQWTDFQIQASGRGRKKGVVKQETLDQFVKSNHVEELSSKIAKSSSIDEVTSNGIMDIEKNDTNSENATKQESLQLNGTEKSEFAENSKSNEIINDAKIEMPEKNESKLTTEDKLEVKENTSKRNVGSKRGRKPKKDLSYENKDSNSEVPIKRSKRNKSENSDAADENKVKIDESNETAEGNTEKDEKTRVGRNKKQNNTVPVGKAPKTGRGKKLIEQGDTQESKNQSETEQSNVLDKNTVLKVSIKRDEELDRRSLEEAEKKKSAKGGNKSAAKGKRARADEAQDSDSKPAKIPKSKGQSKKDKMPDVTLLDFENTSKSPDGKLWNLKLSSWNVNGVRAWLEKDGLAYLHHESPDVLCIQETKCSDDKLPDEVKVDGYHSYWLAGDKDGYSGVGMLSKVKPISVKYGIGVKEHDNEGRVITAEYDNFFLVSAYVPNAGRGLVRLNYRMQWDKDFLSYLKSLDEKKPIVLCGDLNVAHEEIDLANPKTNKKNAGFTKEEREGFSTLLSEGNFIDTYRHLYPDQKAAYTFWTYMMNARAKNVGWRLDYFVISKRFTDHLCDHVIRKDVFGSDHCPITLFLSV